MTATDAILFDFDGVIVESADIKIAAFRALYQQYGEPVVAQVIEHHLRNGGISRRQKIRYCHRTLLGIELAPAELEALCQRFAALVEDAVVAAPFVPGAEAVLARHAGRLPMFVISGTPQDELSRIVARRGLADYFVEVHGSPPEKPPILTGILQRHRLTAQRTIFIGDATTDYEAARVCGIPFLGRVAPGDRNRFPPDTRLIVDLTQLAL
jgi:HAD superfamily hydrolase (TIGR01549 family)